MTIEFPEISIPTFSDSKKIKPEAGGSIFFVGANGSGKTRLSILIHRCELNNSNIISPHRILMFDNAVQSITKERAYSASLNLGKFPDPVNLTNDFSELLQVLFSKHYAYKSSEYDKSRELGQPVDQNNLSLLDKLKDIWDSLLPNRIIKIIEDSNSIYVASKINPFRYAASEMSGGERAIFYLIGRVLCAEKDSLIIIDEPEIHIHRSIMSKLWDILIYHRSDCAFIFITHDLEFVASRVGQKFVISGYQGDDKWNIVDVPEDTGFDEKLVTEILGSREPVLFVEGTDNSLDKAVYRACYPDWKVIAKGSCQEVIHAVSTFKNNESISRIKCAGIIDADFRSESEIKILLDKNIHVLPVSQIENIFLLPDIVSAILKDDAYNQEQINKKISEMLDDLINHINASDNLERCIINYCCIKADSVIKELNLNPKKSKIEEIELKLNNAINEVNIKNIYNQKMSSIKDYIDCKEIYEILKIYNNKGILNISAKFSGRKNVQTFIEFIIRLMNDKSKPDVLNAIKNALPKIPVK